MSHTIESAMSRGELDEEEAFFVLRFAGHLGYREAIRRLNPDPWWTRLRQWFVKFLGAEKPHLMRWDNGAKAWDAKHGVMPIMLFGKRITIQWFGVDIEVPKTRLCIRWRDKHTGPRSWRVFLSPNCTPWAATHWLIGKPQETL